MMLTVCHLHRLQWIVIFHLSSYTFLLNAQLTDVTSSASTSSQQSDRLSFENISTTTVSAHPDILRSAFKESNQTRLCPQLPELKNGEWHLYHVYGVSSKVATSGSRAAYQCDSGYVLQGEAELECQSTGQWSAKPPLCVQQIAYCADPGKFENGSYYRVCHYVKGDCAQNSEGTQLHFYCLEDYELYGNPLIKCLPSSQWSYSKPKCVHKAICKRPFIDNGEALDQPGGFNPGDMTTVVCSTGAGYRLDAVYNNMIVCQSDGSWASARGYMLLPTCIKMQCYPPPVIRHTVSHVYKRNRRQRSNSRVEDGEVAIYMCNFGYELKKPGANRLECKNGQWRGKMPICVKRLHCDRPVNIPYGNWIIQGLYADFRIGTHILYECNDGFTARGTATLTCNKDGYWSDNPPKCEMYCPNPGEIEHGKTVCEDQRCESLLYKVNDEIHYVCDDNYEPDGEVKLVCRKGHKWSSRKPNCLPVDRPTQIPPHLDHGSSASTMTVVIVTSCGVLGVLLVIMLVVAFQRRKSDSTRFCHPVEPPPPPPYDAYERPRSNSVEEHDRVALIAFADGVQVVLPSYEEAVRGRPSIAPVRQLSSASRRSSSSSEYRPLPSIPPGLRGRHDSVRSGPVLRELPPDNIRNSTITMNSTTTNNASEVFGSLDTVNVSDGTSTTVTIDTFSSGMSNPSITTSRHTAAGSLASSNGSLANEDSPLLDPNSGCHGNPGSIRTTDDTSVNQSPEDHNKPMASHTYTTDEETQGILDVAD